MKRPWVLEWGTHDNYPVSAYTFTATAWRSQTTSRFRLPSLRIFKDHAVVWKASTGPLVRLVFAVAEQLACPEEQNRRLLCSWLHSSVLCGTVKVGLLQIKWCNGLGVSTFSISAHPQRDGMRRRGLEEDEVAKVEPLGQGWGPYTRLWKAFSVKSHLHRTHWDHHKTVTVSARNGPCLSNS